MHISPFHVVLMTFGPPLGRSTLRREQNEAGGVMARCLRLKMKQKGEFCVPQPNELPDFPKNVRSA
jgi:hypothetical protein